MDNASRANRAPTDRTRAEQAALAEYDALLTMLAGLTPQQWRAPTECAPWTVRELVAHIAGAAEEAVRLRVQLRHLRTARRGGPLVDALNDQQIADRQGRTPAELLAELTALAKRAPAARRRTPWFIRRRPLPLGAGGLPGDTMGYLLDVIYTRDIWMHRIDIARATGCELPPSTAQQWIVEQIVADLARSWDGPPCRLTLTGPSGGTWTLASPGGAVRENLKIALQLAKADLRPREMSADPKLEGDFQIFLSGAESGRITPDDQAPAVPGRPVDIEIDTVAACRLWSGRSDETGIAADTPVTQALAAARILF